MARQAYDSSLVRIRRNVLTSHLTTLGVGGKCVGYVEVETLADFESAYESSQKLGLRIITIGEGSNLLFSDRGFAGQIIRTRICGRQHSGGEVEIGGGENLSETIQWLNGLGLAGMERMYGIPGTVAGALVGNAGAYGQEIGDVVKEVEAWKAGQSKVFSKRDLNLRYRHSFFKENPGWFIVRCRLKLNESGEDLQSVSAEILEKRRVKYPDGLKCPGSFFKNVMIGDIGEEAQRGLPKDFIIGGKIPAGKLLEAVGACGASQGDAQFADYHGNLIVNKGNARSEDILALANEYAGRVAHRFSIFLEPEILIVDDGEWPYLRPVRAED